MGKKEVKDKKIINFAIRIFWIFVIGSVIGFLLEILYALVYTRSIEIRKGMIYGPFIQVYGMGAVCYYFLISKVKDPKEAFIFGMIMGGVVEYIFSFLQEIFFGTVSWDYSNNFFNLNGRTSLTYTVYWGIIAVIYLLVVDPIFKKSEYLIYKKGVRIFTYLFMIFMLFDITISWIAVNRQMERAKYIEPKNVIDQFLDDHYPDELLNKVYHNKKEIDSIK